jgi:glycosyltransferase involved in cell wall biosynthesis
MKILVVTPYFPHPRAGHGGGEYVYGLVQQLAVSHEVTLLSFLSRQEQDLVEDVRTLPIRLITISRGKDRQRSFVHNVGLAFRRALQLARSIVLWEPYYVSKFYHPRMARTIARETTLARYDIVQIEYSQMGQYAKFVRSGRTVLREHDVSFRPAYRNFRRSKSLLRKGIAYVEWCRWARYEPGMIRRFDHVLTFTRQDQHLLERLAGVRTITANELGIDAPASVVPYEGRMPQMLLFVGTFNHTPNFDSARWLCEEIFPDIVKRYPAATLHLIGRNLPRTFTDHLPPGVFAPGFVERIEEYYGRASVFIAPVRLGGGIKSKILHAQIHGLPVVTTPTGAEGIEGQDASTILVGRTAAELTAAVARLFEDRALAARIGAGGRAAMMRHYAWEAVAGKITELYRSL